MVISYILFLSILILMVISIFILLGKQEKWMMMLSSGFECGFSSYFFSRFSFSIHYFVVAMIFLFLDLELCVLMPILLNFSMEMMFFNLSILFLCILLSSLFGEWFDTKLEWSS